MNEIGQKLKEARESHGVSIEEAANDLNLRTSQIENIEAGNLKVFKDVFYLKCFVRDYAKYLGLDEETIIDEFNEYFFEETSKIPIKEIEKASKQKQKEQNKEKKVTSPYTNLDSKKGNTFVIVAVILIILLLILIGYIVVRYYVTPNNDNEIITYLEKRFLI